MAGELRKKHQPLGECVERFDPPTGASDDSSMEYTGIRRSSRETMSKETQRFEDNIKHFIREFSDESFSEGTILKAALQDQRRRLTRSKTQNDMPIKT